MSAQDDVLKLEATSAGAFVRPPLLLWFVAAAAAVPFVLLVVGGRESNKLLVRRQLASDLKMKGSVIEHESLDRFDDDGGNQQL